MIVVLDEVALGETHAVADGLTGDGDRGNGEIPCFPDKALDAIERKNTFVQCGGVKRVRPVHLIRVLDVVVGGGKLRDDVRATVMQRRTEITAINAIVLEILVDADKVL